MIVLKTIVHNTIWGGHLYSLYCRKDISNEILNGPWKGMCLNDVFPLFKTDFNLSQYQFFPITLALTNARQDLSIQVHPNDKMAKEQEQMIRGKRESWYFIEAPHSGTIINGCTCSTKAEGQLMIQQGRFMEMADTLPVKVGDYVFVEPGTLHAITAGSLVFEIEEGSDSTYRFYDYDREDLQGNKRELHLEKASKALDIKLKSKTKSYNGNEIKEKTYSTKLINNMKSYTNESCSLECFSMVKGELVCENVQVEQGTTILLWPGETLDTHQVELAFVSKMKEDML